MSPAEIVATRPTITLAQARVALAYDYRHRDEIRAACAEEARSVDELKARSGASLSGEKLKVKQGRE